MSKNEEKKMVNIQKIGDELLTAFVNKEYEKTLQIWSQLPAANTTLTSALHKYSNPAITDVAVPRALLYAYEGQDDSPRPPSPIEMYENGWITRTTCDVIHNEMCSAHEPPHSTPAWDYIQEKTKHMWQ